MNVRGTEERESGGDKDEEKCAEICSSSVDSSGSSASGFVMSNDRAKKCYCEFGAPGDQNKTPRCTPKNIDSYIRYDFGVSSDKPFYYVGDFECDGDEKHIADGNGSPDKCAKYCKWNVNDSGVVASGFVMSIDPPKNAIVNMVYLVIDLKNQNVLLRIEINIKGMILELQQQYLQLQPLHQHQQHYHQPQLQLQHLHQHLLILLNMFILS